MKSILISIKVNHLFEIGHYRFVILVQKSEFDWIFISFKGAYYLYLHPWASLNPLYTHFKMVHGIFCGVLLIASMIVTAVYSTSSSTITFIGCLIFIMVIFGLIFISLKTDCCQCLSLSCQTYSAYENVNDGEQEMEMQITQTISEVSETQSATRKHKATQQSNESNNVINSNEDCDSIIIADEQIR